MIFRGRIWRRQLSRQLLRPKRFAILEACLIGLVAAFAAVLLKEGVGYLGGWRVHMAQRIPAIITLPLIGLICGLLAGILVQLTPEASGSGIPQVKAVLAKEPISLDLRVALVKLGSGILALGAGLPLGREGPTVQVGAALAAQISRWVPTSPDYRRQVIAAGAGAGLAAAFNTPIAGVLFVVEELLQDVSGFTLGTAILASFIGAVVSRWLGGHSLDLELTALQTNFSPSEIPFYLLMGVVAGLLGSLFNEGIIASLKLNRRLRLSSPFRIALAGLVCGLVIALLPPDFRDSAGLREMLTKGEASWQLTLMAFVAQFVLTLVAYGSGAPGGLFAPVLILGASLGYLTGLTEYHLLGASLPVTYALAGMGTFFAAVVRVPITGIVIVFEMTTDFNLVLPLMISSAVAYLVADKASPGSLYDRLLEWRGIHLEKTDKDDFLTTVAAADVMQRQVDTLSTTTTIAEALQTFSHTSHHNLPVLEGEKVVGIISQKNLADIGVSELVPEAPIGQIMTPEPMTVRPTATLAYVLYLLNRYNISCLPVTEGLHLLGIITHNDIIRVTANRVEGVTAKTPHSYVVYETRAPLTGKGRLLVPLNNPETAETLLKLAMAIARERHYEIECLQVIIVPGHLQPNQTEVNTVISRRLLKQAVVLGKANKIPIHTQIRVAHDVTDAILETIKQRYIDLLVMGWKGSTNTPGYIFSRVADTVIQKAPCEVVVAKFPTQSNFNRWLIPVAGGPNASEAVKLLPALVTLSTAPEINLCKVFLPNQTREMNVLKEFGDYLQSRVKAKIETTPVNATSVQEAIISLAKKQHSDVILIGATREKLLQQAIKGNIPETIARKSNCTVILVRI